VKKQAQLLLYEEMEESNSFITSYLSHIEYKAVKMDAWKLFIYTTVNEQNDQANFDNLLSITK